MVCIYDREAWIFPSFLKFSKFLKLNSYPQVLSVDRCWVHQNWRATSVSSWLLGSFGVLWGQKTVYPLTVCALKHESSSRIYSVPPPPPTPQLSEHESFMNPRRTCYFLTYYDLICNLYNL